MCRPSLHESLPLGALTKRKGGGVDLNKEICDGCGNCMEACIMGAIHLDAEKKSGYLQTLRSLPEILPP
ncbi:4Fe-4S binding protein [Methanosarcina horonobensis]|uniref:4Fe-4S binding protein n=1 Tax=Methanosarcina horonobensis TaxID=418008 RepID=UPI00373FDA48